MNLFVSIKKKLPEFELDISFETDNNILGILGASGAGKSMTLRCIAGLDKPDTGQIILDDRVLFDSQKGINVPSRKRKIGFLFQSYALFPHMTVEQNIGFGLDALTKEEQNRKIREMISMMQLDGLEKRYPHQISGGQQQRVALARALAVEPEALLLDEPFSALDEYLRDMMVNQLLESLGKYRGVTLFVSHNIDEAYRVCDNLIVISKGKREAFGSKDDIFNRPPSFAAAQITGCRNFSRVRRISGHEVEAVDWGCTLCVGNFADNIEYIGIRDHFISCAENNMQKNISCCWPVFTSETPFRVTVYLSLGKPQSETRNYHLQWEMSKEEWTHIKDKPLPWYIYLDPDKLFCLPC